jgi:VWFA-related protein
MKSRWNGWLFLLVTCGISICAMGQGSQPPTSDKPQVTVFLTASAKDGSPVTLTSSNLTVSVDRHPAQIDKLRSANSDPLLFAVLVDTSKSEGPNAEVIRNAVLQIFQNLSGSRNQGYLVLFNHLVEMSNTPLQISQVQEALKIAKFQGGTAVYDAIELACVQKLSRSANSNFARRIIVLISDGEDNSSRVSHERAETVAQTEGVAIFPFVIPSSASLGESRGEHFMKDVSQQTGGRTISSKNLAEGIPLLQAAIQEQWELSVTPVQAPDQKLHSLQIKSAQKDIHISAPAQISLR